LDEEVMTALGQVTRITGMLLASVVPVACQGTTGAIVGGVVGATLMGAQSPSHEIEQIYYLGVFDPQEQVPETIYRITVRGQASIISFTRFASGWVPAAMIDSLGGRVQLSGDRNAADPLTVGQPAANVVSQIQTGRRLVLFGPEGFREAPRDHRLVIVMGSSPEEFFKAIDGALGEFAQVQLERDNAGLQRDILQALLLVRTDEKTFKDVELEILRDFPAKESK
jgi:hypothetical protein